VVNFDQRKERIKEGKGGEKESKKVKEEK